MAPTPEIGTLLGQVRRELAHLIGDIDTATVPCPDVINPAEHSVPGPEWQPVKGYTVRVHEPSGGSPPEGDCVHVIWPDEQWSGDMDAMSTRDARRIAVALLAAADWADDHTAGVVHLPPSRSAP